MKWICDGNIITDDIIENIEKILKIKFPEDFLDIIKKYDGGYPFPNAITFSRNEEIVSNLISFLETDASYILDIIERTEFLKNANLVPIAEDPFGNLFCYDFTDGKTDIVFWNHEGFDDDFDNEEFDDDLDEEELDDEDIGEGSYDKNADGIIFVCSGFTEFIEMLHE